MRRLLTLLALMFLGIPLHAQYAADTLSRSTFRASQLIAPALLGGAGLLVHYTAHESVEVPVYESSKGCLGDATPYVSVAGDVLRFAPSAAHIGLGLVGVKSDLGFGDRALESFIAHGICVGAGYAAKYIFRVTRPDGSDTKSFPSGHATVAFTGAELMRMDYGNLWGAGAYVLSSGVALSRLNAGRHWFSDLLAGAGLGILSAHAGRWLLEPVKSLFGFPEWTWDGLSGQGSVQAAFVPCADPLSGTPMAGVAVRF